MWQESQHTDTGHLHGEVVCHLHGEVVCNLHGEVVCNLHGEVVCHLHGELDYQVGYRELAAGRKSRAPTAFISIYLSICFYCKCSD